MHGGTCRGDAQLNLPVTPSLWGREVCQPSRLGPGAAAWQGSEAGSAYQVLPALQGRPRAHLDDEASGRALPDPEAKFPLFPLPQLPLCARGNEHGVLVNQGFM